MSAQLCSRVDIEVSGGRVIVPELTGQREEEALSRIEAVGPVCGMITYETVENARQDGVVLSQSLVPFSEVLPESGVEMTVGYYDKRKYSASVSLQVDVPREGVSVRVTLVREDGKEIDMYAATHTQPGRETISPADTVLSPTGMPLRSGVYSARFPETFSQCRFREQPPMYRFTHSIFCPSSEAIA